MWEQLTNMCGNDSSSLQNKQRGNSDIFILYNKLLCGKISNNYSMSAVGYEVLNSQRGIISYPTSTSGIIVLLKQPQNIDKDQSANFIL